MGLTAVIETARRADAEAVLGVLKSAGEDKLLRRPEADYRRSIEAGLFCLARSGGALVGIAGAFPLSEARPAFIEMGSCYVAPPFRGFGLQKLLVRARIGAIVAGYGEDARIFTAVTPHNLGSRASILKAGFEPLGEHARLLLDLCEYCASRPGEASDRLCCCDFFHISSERQRREIAALLRPGPASAVRANGERLAVAMEIDALKPGRRAALEAFAGATPAGAGA